MDLDHVINKMDFLVWVNWLTHDRQKKLRLASLPNLNDFRLLVLFSIVVRVLLDFSVSPFLARLYAVVNRCLIFKVLHNCFWKSISFYDVFFKSAVVFMFSLSKTTASIHLRKIVCHYRDKAIAAWRKRRYWTHKIHADYLKSYCRMWVNISSRWRWYVFVMRISQAMQ